jgi:prolyl-tRNA editing enzyme YbaK/EbsC (Cys-tRNA(Pro) deacylase)
MESATSDDPEARVLDALHRAGVSFERLPCDPDAADTAVFCARYGYPAESSLNTIVVASKKEPRRYAACVVRASTLLDVNRTVRKLLGVPRLSFATAEETVRVTGMQVGGVTPIALPSDWPVFVDEAVRGLDYVILGGGGRSSKLKLSPRELARLPRVQFIPGLGIERAARDAEQ